MPDISMPVALWASRSCILIWFFEHLYTTNAWLRTSYNISPHHSNVRVTPPGARVRVSHRFGTREVAYHHLPEQGASTGSSLIDSQRSAWWNSLINSTLLILVKVEQCVKGVSSMYGCWLRLNWLRIGRYKSKYRAIDHPSMSLRWFANASAYLIWKTLALIAKTL